MTDRKRHVRSEGIFQQCSLVTAPRGNDKANGWYFIFLGEEAVVLFSVFKGMRLLPQKKWICFSSLAHGVKTKHAKNHCHFWSLK